MELNLTPDHTQQCDGRYKGIKLWPHVSGNRYSTSGQILALYKDYNMGAWEFLAFLIFLRPLRVGDSEIPQKSNETHFSDLFWRMRK